MKKSVALIIIAALVVVASTVGYKVSVHNRCMDLSTRFEQQLGQVEGFHDTMWKTIKQQAGVTDKAKDAFKEIYIPLMEGRYSNGGKMMQWVKEQNPNFDTTMYEKLMVSIESLRKEFFHKQEMVLDTVREYNRIKRRFPSSMFASAEDLNYTVISSSKSKEVMASGVDNDISLD